MTSSLVWPHWGSDGRVTASADWGQSLPLVSHIRDKSQHNINYTLSQILRWNDTKYEYLHSSFWLRTLMTFFPYPCPSSRGKTMSLAGSLTTSATAYHQYSESQIKNYMKSSQVITALPLHTAYQWMAYGIKYHLTLSYLLFTVKFLEINMSSRNEDKIKILWVAVVRISWFMQSD